MPKIILSKVGNMVGFTTQNSLPGSTVEVLSKAFFTSDDKEFYQYIKQITQLFLNRAGLFVNFVSNFLVIIHSNQNADIYVNDFKMILEARVKRSVTAGEKVSLDNVANMGVITFPDIVLSEKDNIIYCFKVGWKFGLYFNFLQIDWSNESNARNLFQELGRYYSYLIFEDVYKSLENEQGFAELIKDGWFPFVQLLGGDYEAIIEAYKSKFDFRNRIKKVLDKYTADFVKSLSVKWWNKPVFLNKKKILEAGLIAYYEGTEAGYINSIKNIYTEIEGILQGAFSPVERKSIPELCDLLKAAGEGGVLYFSSQFKEYLSNFLYGNFDIETGKMDLSRHTIGHGLAKPEDYGKIQALQGILILDQIFYYLS
jgi:hypothetical protein